MLESEPTEGRVILTAIHAEFVIERPSPSVILLRFTGHDVGEFGSRPFQELEQDFARGVPIEIFLDAWEVRSASVEVSSDWAHWMMAHRRQIYRFNILCRTSFVRMTAHFVQRFTEFGDQMRIYTEPKHFVLSRSIACGSAGV